MFSGWRYVLAMLEAGDVSGVAIYILSVALAMLVALSFHECAHAFVAYKLGDPTAKNMGRVTLDPTKHIDPMGAVCFLLFGFGWAKPVMINPRNLKNYRRDDVLISIAGPLTNLILAFLCYGILSAAVVYTDNTVMITVASYLVSINLSLAIFNIIPIPPLDGFHVLTSIFVRKSHKVVEFLYRYGRYILIALMLTDVLDVIMTTVWNWILPLFDGFWALFF